MDPKNRIDHLDELLLREEGEGILLLAIQGAIKHLWELKNGGDFVLTETQQNRVDKLLNESQSVRFFVQDHIGVDEVKKGVCNALRAKNAMRSGTPFFNEIRPDGPKKGVHEDGSDQEKGVHDPQSDLERGGSKESAVDLEASRRVAELLKLERSKPLVEANFSDCPQTIDISRFYGNSILFGHDPCARIVAVEFRSPNLAVEYLRDEGGATASRITRFNAFLWDEMADDRSLLELRRFSSWDTVRGCYSRRRNQRMFWDPKQQFLTASGRTLFKGMRFEEVRRLQLDIETSCAEGYEMSNPERDHILAIAISDSSGWEKLLDSPEEGAMLRELSAIIAERDPDVIEGHNIFGFDLPFGVLKEHAKPQTSILSRAVQLEVPRCAV